MTQGWIKLHRKILDWEWFDDYNTFRLFIFLILNANHEDKKWRGIDIKRGQFLISREKLAKKVKLSIQQTRTSLSKLKSTNEITIKSTNKNSLITIVNYSIYQKKEKETTSKSTSKSTANQPATNQQINQQLTTNNNIKKEKNEKNVKKKELDFDEINNFDDLFSFWEKNRNGKPYKNKTRSLKKLKELTNNDIVFAKQVIDNSIVNNYAGFCKGNSLFLKSKKEQPQGLRRNL